MIRRILSRRRPTLVGISLEEELALLRVELMYGLRVSREAYLRRKMEEREELTRRLHGRDPAELLAELRGCLERVAPRKGGSRPGRPGAVGSGRGGSGGSGAAGLNSVSSGTGGPGSVGSGTVGSSAGGPSAGGSGTGASIAGGSGAAGSGTAGSGTVVDLHARRRITQAGDPEPA